jgi:hypothetical protein
MLWGFRLWPEHQELMVGNKMIELWDQCTYKCKMTMLQWGKRKVNKYLSNGNQKSISLSRRYFSWLPSFCTRFIWPPRVPSWALDLPTILACVLAKPTASFAFTVLASAFAAVTDSLRSCSLCEGSGSMLSVRGKRRIKCTFSDRCSACVGGNVGRRMGESVCKAGARKVRSCH